MYLYIYLSIPLSIYWEKHLTYLEIVLTAYSIHSEDAFIHENIRNPTKTSQSAALESQLSPLTAPQPPHLSMTEALLWLGVAKKTGLPLP